MVRRNSWATNLDQLEFFMWHLRSYSRQTTCSGKIGVIDIQSNLTMYVLTQLLSHQNFTRMWKWLLGSDREFVTGYSVISLVISLALPTNQNHFLHCQTCAKKWLKFGLAWKRAHYLISQLVLLSLADETCTSPVACEDYVNIKIPVLCKTELIKEPQCCCQSGRVSWGSPGQHLWSSEGSQQPGGSGHGGVWLDGQGSPDPPAFLLAGLCNGGWAVMEHWVSLGEHRDFHLSDGTSLLQGWGGIGVLCTRTCAQPLGLELQNCLS